jgi:hypothetical protein
VGGAAGGHNAARAAAQGARGGAAGGRLGLNCVVEVTPSYTSIKAIPTPRKGDAIAGCLRNLCNLLSPLEYQVESQRRAHRSLRTLRSLRPPRRTFAARLEGKAEGRC